MTTNTTFIKDYDAIDGTGTAYTRKREQGQARELYCAECAVFIPKAFPLIDGERYVGLSCDCCGESI